jgi:hypothetical protein
VLGVVLTLVAWGFSQRTERRCRSGKRWLAGFASDLAMASRPRASEIG